MISFSNFFCFFFYLGNVSGSGPMSAVRVVLFGHEIVHKVVHFVLRIAGSRGIATASVASTANVYFTVHVCTARYENGASRRIGLPRVGGPGTATKKNCLRPRTIAVIRNKYTRL